jgi:hypothetical protein
MKSLLIISVCIMVSSCSVSAQIEGIRIESKTPMPDVILKD